MDRTLIVCASHHGIELQTQACITLLQKHGARLLSATGIADVALARNDVLSRALAHKGPADVFLLVDDDMILTLSAASKLVGLARQTGECWSAAYATKEGALAATPLEWDASRTDGLRMVGLGCCAIPVAKLEALAERLGLVIGPHDKRIYPFCECRVVTPAHDGLPRWCSEDYWLCRALGGMRLAPYVAAGHLKQIPLWPDDETLRRLAEGVPLTGPEATPAPASTPAPTNPETPASKKKKQRSKRKVRNANGSAQTRP